MTPENEPQVKTTSDDKSLDLHQADPRLLLFDKNNQTSEGVGVGEDISSITTGEGLDYDPSWANDPACDGPFAELESSP